jgi:hypothetical protein
MDMFEGLVVYAIFASLRWSTSILNMHRQLRIDESF